MDTFLIQNDQLPAKKHRQECIKNALDSFLGGFQA